MPRKTITVDFPTLGVVRRLGLRSSARGQGPTAAPWSMNCRLEDSLTNRLRGGSFTGQAASSVADARYLYLTTENGDYIVTENGDNITLGPQYDVVFSDGRTWVPDGDDAPTTGTADCVYRDRLLRVDGGVIFASRQGNTAEWDRSKDVGDTGRATIFQLSESGEIGEDVIALVPHKDSFLLCFTAAETWILKGDPVTGSLRNVSREVGVIAARAWCKNHDTVYFLSSLGLYSVGADGSGLKPVSEDKIPEDLTGVSDSACVLDYYHADRGCYIHKTTSPSWFYDTARDQFWPFDTTETDSHVLIGPFQVGQANSYGRILNIQGNIAADSDDVAWRLVTGETAEETAANGKAAIVAALGGGSYSDYVASSGTWSEGRAHIAYPRNRALWCCLWLHSEGDWAWETASMGMIVSGKWR